MSITEKNPVLEYIVKTLKEAIADAVVENLSPGVYMVIDGLDEIRLEAGADGKILITDERRIIYSEDLMEPLQNIHEAVKGDETMKAALESTTIIINGLNIETELVFQAIKDLLDQVSNSYEFNRNVSSKVTDLETIFKFGKHLFGMVISNTKEKISIRPTFPSAIDPGIKKTVTADVAKVEVAANKMFGK